MKQRPYWYMWDVQGSRSRALMRVVRLDRDDGVLPYTYIHVSGSDGARQICLGAPRSRGRVVPTTDESPRAAMVQRREHGDGAALGIRRSPDTDQHFQGDQRTKLW